MIVMSGILSITIGYKSTNELKNEKGEALEEIAYQMADKMDAYMWSRSGEIFTLSNLKALHNFEDSDSIQKLLEELKLNIPSFSWIGLTDSKGTVLASTEGVLSGVDISERPVYLEGKKGKFIGDVHDAVLLAKFLPNPSGEPMKFVDVSTPILDTEGVLLGVLAAHLSWDWAYEIQETVVDPLNDRSNIDMFVISSKDNVILLGNKEMIGTPLHLEGLDITKQAKTHWSIETWEDGKQYLTGYTYADGYLNYKGLGWTVVVRQPLKEAYHIIVNLQYFILIVGIACAVIFSLIIWFVAHKVSDPMKQISLAAENLKLGKLVKIPQYRGIKEIEMLSVSLRELIGSLIKSEIALDEMEVKACNDFLTGIPNRIGLINYLASMTQDNTQTNLKLMFLCLDLDGFKNVNDTYGHHIGDVLLQGVSKRLSDLVKQDGIVARLGGDEFVVVVPADKYMIDPYDTKFADRIIQSLNESFHAEGHSFHVGCSVGIAIWDETLTTQQVLNCADEALYTSKHNGKNMATFYIVNK
jgi:diguanylate cyclase (GGDEF)-like protein